MTKVTVFAKNNDMPCTRDVITFLDKNLDQLVAAGLRFKFHIVNKSDVPDLKARGITKVPAISVEMAGGTKIFLSSIEIKSALIKLAGSKLAQPQKMRGPTRPEDDLQKFYEDEMNPEKYKDDLENGGDDSSSDMVSKAQSEMERRERENKVNAEKHRGGRHAERERTPAVTPRATRKIATPQDRVIEAGGDPMNKDDKLLLQMMETSDD